MEQVPGPVYAGLIDQLIPGPVGSGSEIVTARAVPEPLFVTVIVKPRLPPTSTVGASAVFVIVKFGQFTVIDADARTEPSLAAVAVAVFGYVPQPAFVLALVTCTDADAPGSRSPNAQLRFWAGAEPVIEQAALAGLIDQSTPFPPGSGSASVTADAVPEPVLETAMVNPIGSPALTTVASAVFVIWRPGHCTSVLALACTCGLFVA
jgi:hypothetical protein